MICIFTRPPANFHTQKVCMLSCMTLCEQAPLPWDSPGKKSRVGCHPFFRGSSRPRVKPVSLLFSAWACGGFFTSALPESPGKNLRKTNRGHLCDVTYKHKMFPATRCIYCPQDYGTPCKFSEQDRCGGTCP